MENTKQFRLLEIFFRAIRGEEISVKRLADEYSVSSKSIGRNIADLKAFLADNRELVGNTELEYSNKNKSYHLIMDEFLSSKELFAALEVIIGARAFSKEELLTLVNKMKRFTSGGDKAKLAELIRKELYYYPEVKHDCESVQDRLWQVINCITEKREISIEYYRMDRKWVTHRLRPASVMFTDYYFYLIAFVTEGKTEKPYYFRLDRIKNITEHRKKFQSEDIPDFNEGLLRKRSLFMWPGELRTVRFEFSGPSVQAVLDKLPTAKIIERLGADKQTGNNKYLIEAESYGDGIKMWLLSQGAWVKVITPPKLVEEVKREVRKMMNNYN